MQKNYINRLVTVGALGCLLGFVAVSHAVEPRVYQLGDGGAIAPHLSVEFGSDDNPLRSERGSPGSAYLHLEPEVRYIARRRNNSLTLGYAGDYIKYTEDYCRGNTASPGSCSNGERGVDKASYEDHLISIDGKLEVSRKLRASLNISRALVSQPLGTGLSATSSVLVNLVEPDSYTRDLTRLQLSYGALKARGEARVALTYTDKAFDSRAGSSGDNLSANLSEQSFAPSATLLYRIGNRTQIFYDFGLSEVRGGNSERDITRNSVGIEVDASAITSGKVQVNNVTEDFIGFNRRDLSYSGWEVEATWKPRRYSTVKINGGRETERGLFNENIGITTKLNLDWRHAWRQRFSTNVGLKYQLNEDIDQPAQNDDSDDRTTTFRFGANYSLRRWLDIGGFVVFDSRTGRGDRNYDRNLVGVSASGTI